MTPTSGAMVAVEAEAVGVQLEAQDHTAVALIDPDGARVRVDAEGEEVDLGRGRVAASEREAPDMLATNPVSSKIGFVRLVSFNTGRFNTSLSNLTNPNRFDTGMKWTSGSTKRQGDRALGGPWPRRAVVPNSFNSCRTNFERILNEFGTNLE